MHDFYHFVLRVQCSILVILILTQPIYLVLLYATGELTQIEDGGDPGDYPGGDGGSDSDEGPSVQGDEEQEEEAESEDEEADMIVLDPEHVGLRASTHMHGGLFQLCSVE